MELVRLESVVEILDHKRVPISSKDRAYRKGQYPYYGAQGIVDWIDDYIFDGTYILVAEDGENLKSQNQPIAQLVSGQFWVNNHAHILGTKKGFDLSYVFYMLNSLNLSGYITGSAQPKLNQDNLRAIMLPMPAYDTQVAISNILSSLDAKIALNRRMNEELEGMAKMLYDYWFVQFDFPNEEGKPYKSSGGAMEYNAVLKREIPAGWKVEKLTKIADTYSGGTPNSTTAEYYQDGDIPWINSGEINHPIITKTDNYITELGMNNSSAKKIPAGAILVAMYGATAGKSSYLSFDATTNQAVCGVVPHKEYLLGYIQLYLSSLENYFSSISTGSARRNISQDLIRNTPIVIPSEKIISIFYQQHGPILRQRVSLQQEIEHLTVLRDKLLPLLMNGQVRVAD